MKYLNLKNLLFYLLIGLQVVVFTACKDDLDAVVEELQLGRLLSPGDLDAKIRNQTTIEVSWQLRDGVDSYVVEFSEDSLEFSTIIRTVSVLPEELPIQETFFGDTRYSVRVKAIGDESAESNWAAITIKTNPEQIFDSAPLIAEDTYVTLVWAAGSEVTSFLIQPGNIFIPISDEQKALGEATITGLNGATTYTATIYNGTKKRGTKGFATIKQANVTPLDDLGLMIDNAAEGATLVLAPGSYALGGKAITKSITIEGQKPSNMPIVTGQFTFGVAVTSVAVKNINLQGGGINQAFNTSNAAANVGTLLVDGCEISGYNNNVIYNQASGTYGNVTISNSYIHDVLGSGGDGFDIRGGTFTSLTVENSTFSTGIRSFLRMQVASNVAFRNCTFYKVCNVASSNNRGFFRSTTGGTLEVSKCLFVETGVDDLGTLRGSWATLGDVNAAVTADYRDNYYFNAIGLFTGQYTTPSEVDATEADPGFEDAANGDFTVTNQLIIDEAVGDPKWWF